MSNYKEQLLLEDLKPAMSRTQLPAHLLKPFAESNILNLERNNYQTLIASPEKGLDDLKAKAIEL